MSEKIEMRKVRVVYCDYCGKEITDYSHTETTDKKTGLKQNFHDTYTNTIKETCFEKYQKEKKGGGERE